MKILFDVFHFKEEYLEKRANGIINRDDPYSFDHDCYTKKMLFDLNSLSVARPCEDERFTEISNGDGIFYIVAVPFKDFLKITPHRTYAYMKSKWAN